MAHPESGGSGGESGHARDDRLLARAIREGWPITPNIQHNILKHMCRIVERSKKPREKISAARAVLAADALNLERARLALAAGDESDSDGPGVIVIHAPTTPTTPPPAET